MSHYVTADLHGCYDAFINLLQKIDFQPEDTLYVIGDVVDRGAEGIRLLQHIKKTPNIILLLGNHEVMMRDALASGDNELWFYNGGMMTFHRFSRLSLEEQTEIKAYLKELPLFLDVTVGDRQFRLIHGCPMADENDVENSVWGRPDPANVFFTDKTVIVGHTPTMCYGDDCHILHGKNIIDVDCGYVYRGLLGCLRLEDLREYYIS